MGALPLIIPSLISLIVSVDVKHHVYFSLALRTLVGRFGLAAKRQAGKQRDPGSNPLRLSFLLKRCGLWSLSCDFVPHN